MKSLGERGLRKTNFWTPWLVFPGATSCTTVQTFKNSPLASLPPLGTDSHPIISSFKNFPHAFHPRVIHNESLKPDPPPLFFIQRDASGDMWFTRACPWMRRRCLQHSRDNAKGCPPPSKILFRVSFHFKSIQWSFYTHKNAFSWGRGVIFSSIWSGFSSFLLF